METITLDRYTKFILTIIALCLLAIVFKPLYITESAKAFPSETSVNISSIGGKTIYGEIPVELRGLPSSIGVYIENYDY